jgi:transcriptional antiterminator NusG
MKWYILRIMNGKEKKVKESIDKLLESNPSLKKHVMRVVLPIEKIYKIRNKKKYSVDRNFYPGYLLIESDLKGETIHIIENLTNVIHFLKDNGIPTPLRKNEIENILKRLDKIESKKELDIPFIVGESVQIIDGPFTSFTGEIVKINEMKKTVELNVKIFGRETSLELSFLQIDKI